MKNVEEKYPVKSTTPAKARKMMRDGVAVGKFNKLDIVQMMIPVGDRTQDVSLSVDLGSKYDGYAVGTDREISSRKWRICLQRLQIK